MLFSLAMADWRGCFSLAAAGAGAAERRFGGCLAVRCGKDERGNGGLEANHVEGLQSQLPYYLGMRRG